MSHASPASPAPAGLTTAGLRRIAQGGEAEIFEWPSGEVLRLLRESGDHAAMRILREAEAMTAAASAGVRVPRPGAIVAVDGRPGILLERIAGRDLLTRIGQKPWLVWQSGRMTGRTHAHINAIAAPPGLGSVKTMLGSEIGALEPHDPSLFRWVLGVLDTLPEGDRLLHGDFHPGQLLMDGNDPVTIDWPSASRGDPHSDFARSRVILSMGTPPQGTAAPLQFLAMFARRLLVGAYSRAYRRESKLPIDEQRLAAWETVHVAARIADGFENERGALVARLRRERARADKQTMGPR